MTDPYLSQQTICEELLLLGAFCKAAPSKVKNTIFVSQFYIGAAPTASSASESAKKVKISLFGSNLQVTKVFNSRVGTSEAIRLLSYIWEN